MVAACGNGVGGGERAVWRDRGGWVSISFFLIELIINFGRRKKGQQSIFTDQTGCRLKWPILSRHITKVGLFSNFEKVRLFWE